MGDFVEQIKTIEASKVAHDIASSFLGGFAAAALMIIAPDITLNDPGSMLHSFGRHLIDPEWEYHFWNFSFGCALATAFGLRMKSAFDKFNINLNVPRNS